MQLFKRTIQLKKFHPQLYNALQFRLSRIKTIEEFIIVKINAKKKLSRTLNKYITVLDSKQSSASSHVPLCYFAQLAGAPIGIASASISLAIMQVMGFSKCI